MMRALLMGLMILVTTAAALADAPDALQRGAYMAYVTGCVSCHSPHDAAGHVPDGRLLAGGDHPIRASNGHAIYPPNITPDPESGISTWTEQDIVAVLHDGRRPDGSVLSSAMPWQTQFSGLTRSDMVAIARYLRSVPAAKAESIPPHAQPQ